MVEVEGFCRPADMFECLENASNVLRYRYSKLKASPKSRKSRIPSARLSGRWFVSPPVSPLDMWISFLT